jgi:WD40 repeat protein
LIRLTNFNSGDALGEVSAGGLLSVNDFAISPDGDKITLAVTDKNYQRIVFYSMRADGAGIKQVNVLNNEGRPGSLAGVYSMRYSPDGKLIAFLASLQDGGFYLLDDNNDIYFIKELNHIDSKITDIEEGLFVFSPNSKHVLFVAPFSYELFDDPWVWIKSTGHNILLYLNYYLFGRVGGIYDNKYLCVMEVKTGKFKKITKMPISSSLGRDFIHWE